MKINKKILIPVFASAMGLSAIGGIGGAVAWYQYNTKVAASWIGVTTADGGVLQISSDEGAHWNSYADFGSSSTKLHPVTFGAMGATDALTGTAKKHPEAGVTNPENWDDAVLGTDYFQYKFKLQAKKYDSTNHTYSNVQAVVKFDDLHIAAVPSGSTQTADVASAIRVHVTDGTNNMLLSLNGGDTNCFGALDLDGSGSADKQSNYQWETGHGTELVYGVNNAKQSSTAIASKEGQTFVTVPTAGIEITFTIWLEGWQQLRSSAIWDVTKDDGVSVQFGMKLSTEASTFLSDAPSA